MKSEVCNFYVVKNCKKKIGKYAKLSKYVIFSKYVKKYFYIYFLSTYYVVHHFLHKLSEQNFRFEFDPKR